MHLSVSLAVSAESVLPTSCLQTYFVRNAGVVIDSSHQIPFGTTVTNQIHRLDMSRVQYPPTLGFPVPEFQHLAHLDSNRRGRCDSRLALAEPPEIYKCAHLNISGPPASVPSVRIIHRRLARFSPPPWTRLSPAECRFRKLSSQARDARRQPIAVSSCTKLHQQGSQGRRAYTLRMAMMSSRSIIT